MKSTFLKVAASCLLMISCNSFTSKKTQQETTATNTITTQPSILLEEKTFYVPKNIEVLDSTLYKSKPFLAFKSSFKSLNGLDPNDLELHLFAVLSTTNKLLSATLPANFEVPAVKSRLRVVKTQLLRCVYFSKEGDIKSLTLAIDDLFDSYDVLLKRVDDIALSEDALSESEFEVDQEFEKLSMKFE